MTMSRLKVFILTVLSLLLGASVSVWAQFKRDAFTQNYADSTEVEQTDSSSFFSMREFAGGLTHKRHAKLKTMFMGSTVVIGGEQIYNRDYWKLPIIYGGIGAGIGGGVYFNQKWHETGDESFKRARTLSYAAAGLVYWGTLMDGVYCFESTRHPDPAKSTIYSILLPGLGQIYNGEYWKVPIYIGGIAGGVKYYFDNRRNYERYKWIYDQATSEDPTVETPPISAENALYYRDVFRRYRDYSILFTAVMYFLQVMDANVFAYMTDFEVNDDISMRMGPAVVTTDYAFTPSMGVTLSLTF